MQSSDRFVFEAAEVAATEPRASFGTSFREAVTIGIVTLDAAGNVATCNRAAAAIFGVAAATLAGAPVAALERFMRELGELVVIFERSGGLQLRAEVEGCDASGRELALEVQLAPLDDDSGGLAILVADVTRHRRLEATHAAHVDKAERVAASFSRYLAPHVLASLLADPSSIALGGERLRATTLFADIRGFTALAARLPAERVVEILNGYFQAAVALVHENGGLLDKFYGDGLMAVFGAPRPQPDDAARALATARALPGAVALVAQRLGQPLRISVGCATGDVVAGHIGALRRMDYTVIGDSVNLASGLQAAAPPGMVYCDIATYAAAGTTSAGARRIVARVKGRDELVPAYELVPLAQSTATG